MPLDGKAHQPGSKTRRLLQDARPSGTGPSASVVSSLNLSFLEQKYSEYLRDAQAVTPEWSAFFSSLNGDSRTQAGRPQPESKDVPASPPAQVAGGEATLEEIQYKTDQLIRDYRTLGHRAARLDPLVAQCELSAELSLSHYGLGSAHLDAPVLAPWLPPEERTPLRSVLRHLRATYLGSVGYQFMQLDHLGIRTWLQQRIEQPGASEALDRRLQLRILRRLTDAVNFEEFIGKKYVGAKRFSLEGAETLVALLDLALEEVSRSEIEEVLLTMAHRGRLNVLAHILGKPPRSIFREFDDRAPEEFLGRGDVKYHLGFYSPWQAENGRQLHLALAFNPSHLEFVNPVAMGRLRARMDRVGDVGRNRGLLIQIHGDAAFAGEGIVQETLNLSQLPGFTVGGSLHIIVNNQIGFTTPPEEARSGLYASDVAKMLQVPIFHVNGEDPEAVARVLHLALAFRKEFHRDAVIDMYCFRKRGHNEGDEPSFTQPLVYRRIEDQPSVRQNYARRLLKLGQIGKKEVERIAQESMDALERELQASRNQPPLEAPTMLRGLWTGYRGGPEVQAAEPETGVERQTLVALLERMTAVPEGFRIHRKLRRILERRLAMAGGQEPLDWASAEWLAYATLAVEGIRVRLCGQDTQRGTFSHRHAVWHDTEDGRTYAPLSDLAEDQAPVEVYNSPLSEAGVLGFEYGYSLGCPDGLVIWEAQFGDFINAAQVIVDQFIASAEDKWDRLSGLVLLLPHGFEGQGPEHSSARLERFLSLAAEDNIQVAQPTTPAQLFHLLRRQVLRAWRKPLIVLTPKSLLRHEAVTSDLKKLSEGRFRRILPDPRANASRTRRILLCSGKIYYELAEAQSKWKRGDVAVLRVEQLYPLANETLAEALAPFRDGCPVYWVQEEPVNMGAWPCLHLRFGNRLLNRFEFRSVCRPASASPATGSQTSHKKEQAQLVARAFGGG